MAITKYVVVGPGGTIQLLNGDNQMPNGSSLTMQEAWAVFRITTENGQVAVYTVKSRGNVTLNQ
jgi:hypothetical protein